MPPQSEEDSRDPGKSDDSKSDGATGQDARINEENVAAFWDKVPEGEHNDDEQSNYLTAEWPTSLSTNRFNAEVRDVTGWLDGYVKNRESCLDAGCGTGTWLEHLAPRFEPAAGFEISEGMVKAARRRMTKCGLDQVTIEQGSLATLEGEEEYDLIFVGGVLMFLQDDVAADAVKRIRRALRPGGLLISRESTNRTGTRHRTEPLFPGLFADPDAEREPYYAIYRHHTAITDMLTDNGLKVERKVYNRHYKLSDVTESWLWFLNRLHGGRLRTDREAAERWAQRVYSWRAITLLPYFYTCRFLRIPVWNLENYFFLCRRA